MSHTGLESSDSSIAQLQLHCTYESFSPGTHHEDLTKDLMDSVPEVRIQRLAGLAGVPQYGFWKLDLHHGLWLVLLEVVRRMSRKMSSK